MQERIDFDTADSRAYRADWNAPISVSQLNLLARELIERNIPLLWVAGEISNLTRAASGHCYFTLKDERAQVRCVMFRHRMQHLDWTPANGMQVEVRAGPTLYEARGEFQLTAEQMRRAGLGALFEAFSRLKVKLEKEGLFASEGKQPLPVFPRCIGVVTSPAAAALRDVLTTLRRRMPAIPVVLYPTPVQGEGAGHKIAAAIDAASARSDCDVLILCRGGGSIEDLWAFNEEVVARAVFACAVPVVCGVGHETDFTIADFAADARAPTPSGAAELVSPNRVELAARLAALQARSERSVLRGVERRMQVVDYLGRRLIHPGERIGNQQQHLAHLSARLGRAASHVFVRTAARLEGCRHRLGAAALDLRQLDEQVRSLSTDLEGAMQRTLAGGASTLDRLEAHLHALSPQLVLERGYSIASRADGHIVRDGTELQPGEDVNLTFARGGALAKVTATRD